MKSPESFILESLARLAFFFINLFALYLMLRGHNLPGGGFIAGLVTTISLVFLAMALGLGEIRRILKVDPVRVGVLGLILSALTAAAPMLFGENFFTHHMWHFDLPLFGEVEVGTTLLFDLGVYFIVVGMSVKIFLVLSWSTNRYRTFTESERGRYASVLERPIEGITPDREKDQSEEDQHAV